MGGLRSRPSVLALGPSGGMTLHGRPGAIPWEADPDGGQPTADLWALQTLHAGLVRRREHRKNCVLSERQPNGTSPCCISQLVRGLEHLGRFTVASRSSSAWPPLLGHEGFKTWLGPIGRERGSRESPPARTRHTSLDRPKRYTVSTNYL